MAPANRPSVGSALILSAELPGPWAGVLGAVRRQLAPEAAARAPVHLSLFRHLPGPSCDEVVRAVRRVAAGSAAPRLEALAPRQVERALMVPVASPGLLEVRAELSDLLFGLILNSEAAPPRLHITLGPAGGAGKARFSLPPLKSPALLLHAHGPAQWTPLLRAAFGG